MADVAGVLKAEIVRLSKKAVRQSVAQLQRASATHRYDIAALKKQIADLQKSIAALQRANGKQREVRTDDDTTPRRFSAKGLRALRSRLDLSQEDFARLVGVSAQSVFNWEHEVSRPRPAQVSSIAAIRSIGKREARKRLEALAGK